MKEVPLMSEGEIRTKETQAAEKTTKLTIMNEYQEQIDQHPVTPPQLTIRSRRLLNNV